MGNCSCARFIGVLLGRRNIIFLPSTDCTTAGLNIALARPRMASVICGHICAGSAVPTEAGAAAGSAGFAGVSAATGTGISLVTAAGSATGAITGVASATGTATGAVLPASPPILARPVAGLIGACGNAAAIPFSRNVFTASSSCEIRASRFSALSSKTGDANCTTATSSNKRASGACRISTMVLPRVSMMRTMRCTPMSCA